MGPHVSWSEIDAVRHQTATDDRRRAVEEHLGACAECSETMNRLGLEDRELAGAMQPPPGPQDHLRETTAEAVRQFRDLRSKTARRIPWGAILPAAAAAVVMTALLAGMFTKTAPPRTTEPDPIARAIRQLADPATSVSAQQDLARWGHKALPAIRAAEVTATGAAREQLELLKGVIETEKPRVLFVYDQPSGEYLALSDFLVREPTLLAHRLQLSADPPLVGAVSEWAARFPDHAPERFRRALTALPDDLSEYDVVILGDCKAAAVVTLMAQLTDFVTARGGALLVIAGSRSEDPQGAHMALKDLLPVTIETTSAVSQNHRVILTEAGRSSPALAVETEKDSREFFFKSVPDVRWVQKSSARADAQVLLNTTSGSPLLALRRTGKGQVAFVGSNELYMWRAKVGGEKYYLPTYRALLSALSNR